VGQYSMDSNRLEIIVSCVGFDDILAVTLAQNHAHSDNYIVVTSHEDRATQKLCEKFSVQCVPTDLFQKNGRKFNKGAGLNAGWGHFQYHGWRLHLDADVLLPDNFKRLLFNHTSLDACCLYGADRFDVIGMKGVEELRDAQVKLPQHSHNSGVSAVYGGKVYPTSPSASSARYVHRTHGYCPIGFFQLWHSSHQPAEYPYSLGTAAHDDVLFATLWPEANRRLLPSVFVAHLNAWPPKVGENWDGHRGQPRIDGKDR
jgi:hypothetical protein